MALVHRWPLRLPALCDCVDSASAKGVATSAEVDEVCGVQVLDEFASVALGGLGSGRPVNPVGWGILPGHRSSYPATVVGEAQGAPDGILRLAQAAGAHLLGEQAAEPLRSPTTRAADGELHVARPQASGLTVDVVEYASRCCKAQEMRAGKVGLHRFRSCRWQHLHRIRASPSSLLRVVCHDRVVYHSVLIVDDHEDFRRAARTLLQAAGFRVVGEAADGTAAIAMARGLRPDVVLLDIQLPDLDGFAVVEEIVGMGDAPAVVLISSRDAAVYRAKLAETSARGFIPKSQLSGEALASLVR